MRLNVAAGWVVGIISFIALGSFVPEVTCRDGWRSPSIGRMGACSHHGGVNSHEVLYLLILGISVGAGAFTSNFLSRGDGVPTSPSGIGRREPSFSNEIELITNAIENQKRIEFFYKKPSYSTYAKRTVRPKELTSVSHKYGSGYTLCVKGYCELRKDVRSFALKRMTNLRVISDITLTN